MILWHLRFLAIMVGVIASFGVAAQDGQKNESPLGLWQTPGGGVVEISPCGQFICGQIAGIPRARGEPIPKDSTGRSQCRLTIIRQASEGSDGSWSGEITDPRNGTQYHVNLRVDDQGSLHVRGYILLPLLGQTQIWPRYTGRIGPECTLV